MFHYFVLCIRLTIFFKDYVNNLHKVIQLFRVTCFIAGQYKTDLLWHITDVILRPDKYNTVMIRKLLIHLNIGHLVTSIQMVRPFEYRLRSQYFEPQLWNQTKNSQISHKLDPLVHVRPIFKWLKPVWLLNVRFVKP